MKQSSNLNKCTSKYFLGALLFSFLLNSAIIQAQNTFKPKRTVVEIDVSQLDKRFNTNTINCNLDQFNNPLFPKLAARGQNIGEKKFKIVLNLVQSNVFVLIVDEKYGNDYAIDDLFLEPGDSISIKASGDGINDYTKYSGKGANNNPLSLDEKLQISSTEFSEEYQFFWLNKLHTKYAGLMSSLQKRKSTITPGYYNFLSLSYTYDFYNRKISYIRQFLNASLDSTTDNKARVFDKVEEFQKNIFPELFTKTIVNDSFINIPNYFEFIKLFIGYQLALRTQSHTTDIHFNPNKVLFELAYKELPPQTSEFYCAFLIQESLRFPDKKEDVAPYLQEYLKKHPNSIYKDTLVNLFNARGNVGINKPVPDFILKNEKGQHVSLNSFKGKPICLAFYDDNTDWHLEKIAKMANAYPELILIFVYCGTDTSQFFHIVAEYPKAVNLVNYNWGKAKEFNIYYDQENYSPIYLIDNNGVLIKYSPGNDIDFFLHKLVHPSKASSNKAGIWSLIGLIAGFTSTLIIVVWLLLRWRIKYIRKREEKKRKQIEIELRGIRAHMNPHFMFNSLGSIQNLINQSKVQEANLYLSKFAGLMRLILNNSEKELVPLTGEIDAIRTYCELEQLRFGFDYNINIDNNIDIFNTEIPGMLIQPYVENAILHGINYLEKRAGKLDISFKMANNLLICTINDNGIGRQASQALKSTRSSNTNGFGFRLSKERVNLLNSQGKHISLNITDNTNEKGEAEGTTVEIKIETND